jgi:hypothetical protein
MLVSALVAVIYLAIPALAKSLPNKPLKTIAPDLIIETAEQGEFLDDPADPLHFSATNVVPHRNRYLFGWRLKVKTVRQKILVQERSIDGRGKQGVPGYFKPKDGYLFHATDLVETIPSGKYTRTVFVENQPVKTFSYEIK